EEKAVAVKKAQQAVTAAKAEAARAVAEQTAAEKKLASLTATAESAAKRTAKAAEESKVANAELAEARTRAAAAKEAVDAATNPSVRSLAVASRSAGRYDPVLTFTAPHDGDFLVEVRDDLYRGRAEFTYRLTVGELPLVTHVFPAGVRRGTETAVQLGGVNLGEATTLTTALAADASLDKIQHRHITTALGVSNLVPLIPGDAAELMEAEPNDTAEQAMTAELPATVNGIIKQAGDFDSYKFTAAKGQRLIFETVSRQFGSPLDARLDLYDSRGRRLKNSDDENRLPDSSIDYTFPADGEYVITIGDTTGQGSAAHVYRLVAREPQPDFSLTVYPDNPRVTAGGSVAVMVMIDRRDGFSEDVEVIVPDVPEGVVVSPGVITNGQSQVTLSLTMSANAAPTIVPLTIQGKAVIGETETVHDASPTERMRYINEWRYLPVADLQLTVLPQAPYTLEWGQPELAITGGSNLDVPLKLHRTPGFSDPVRITLQGLPSRLNAPVVTFDKDAVEAVVQIRAAGNAPAGTGNAIATGTAKGFAQDSRSLAITVAEPKKAEKKQ
ncbi:MAG: PPC domain-containing protein, partial [Planctomycetaceae bacterium]|nr:PPC domain-containing protein [Planctomycetaceae bacterium]